MLHLDDGAIAFIPRLQPAAAPAPLLVILHGAGQSPGLMIARFEAEAQRHGVILLAPQSLDFTWDMIVEMGRGGGDDSGAWRSRASGDTARIGRVIAALLARAPVDRARIGLAGFSDGASYALAIGFADPSLFSAVIAFSPGMAVLPPRISGRQRAFVSHGRRDTILPYANTAGTIVPLLRAQGLEVVFRSFDGDHEVPPAVEAEAFDFFLAASAPH